MTDDSDDQRHRANEPVSTDEDITAPLAVPACGRAAAIRHLQERDPSKSLAELIRDMRSANTEPL